MNTALEILAPLLTLVVTVATTILARKVNEWFDLKNEKMLRDALHQSAENGLRYALTRGAGPASAEVLAQATRYVKDKNPETLRKLGVSDNDLGDIIKTKVPKS